MTKTHRPYTLAAAALAATLLASCSLDRTTVEKPDTAISFRAFSDSYTKATVTDKSNIAYIYVYAYDASGALYFSDVFRDKGTGGNNGPWESDYPHYWPTDGTRLSFLSFNSSAFDASAGTLLSGTLSLDAISGAKATGVTVPQDINDQKDLVVARVNSQTGGTNGTVSLNYRHALAQIKVMARNSNPRMKVEVIGVKVANIKQVADMEFPTGPTTSSSSTMDKRRWINQKTDASFMARYDQAVRLAIPSETTAYNSYTDILPSGHSFMLIPQNITAVWDGTASTAGAYISILCRISSAKTSTTAQDAADGWIQQYPSDNGKYAFAAVPLTAREWEPGKTYTYKLDFFSGQNGGGGQIDPDPTDPIGPDPDDEVDETPGTGGDSVVGGPIKISLTVDTWDTSTGDIITPMQ